MIKESTQLRARLLKKYNDLMYAQGYEQTTVRQIALECGIGRGHLYFYYSKKEQFPIALRKDLLHKIDRIIRRDIPQAGEDDLLRYFLSMLLVRYMIARKPELFRTQAEYSRHTEVMDGFAELQYQPFQSALADAGIEVPAETAAESLLCATYAEFALVRNRHDAGKPSVDHAFMFRYFNTVLFSLFGERQAALAAVADRAETLFEPLAAALMDSVYQMEEFNYAF